MLANQEDLHLRVIDQTYQIVINQPWVVNLVLPTSMLAGYKVYPSKVEMQFAEQENCRTEWFKAKMVIWVLKFMKKIALVLRNLYLNYII